MHNYDAMRYHVRELWWWSSCWSTKGLCVCEIYVIWKWNREI